MSPIAIFSGSAHPALAEEICTKLHVPLLPTRLKLPILSIAPALAEAMRRINNGESVSALFHSEPTVQDDARPALRA